jgi:phage gp36-like protein
VPYATPQDLIDGYGADRILMLAQLPDGTQDAAKVARALSGASSVIDGYLSIRYALPLTGIPDVLRDACVSIAVYRLASEPGSLAEDMRTRYEDAIAYLKDVARGIAGIGAPTIAQQQAAAAAASPALASPQSVLIEADPRVFTRKTLRSI